MNNQRFVIEYANFRIKECRMYAETFPEKKEYFNGKADTIDMWLGCWKRSLITTNEIMKMISEA